MANVSAILALVGALLATITAVVVFDFLLMVPAGFAIIAGILIVLKEKGQPLIMAGAGIAAVLGLVVALGTGMGWLNSGLGTGLVIAANLEIAAIALKSQWANLPMAAGVSIAVVLAAGAIIALITPASLGFGDIVVTSIVALCCLAGVYPAALALRDA